MKNIFKEEIKKRKENDVNNFSMIGTELKRLRINRSQTLSSIADNVCSVSYLCKVENAKLKPNRYTLQEICKKLNISNPKMEALFGLKNLVNDIVRYYYANDKKAIEKIYNDTSEFENYRSKLINLIYHLTIYNIPEADKVAKELLKITSVMQNEELNIFILFYSILSYYKENYMECIDNMQVIEDVDRNQNIAIMAKYYIFMSHVKINHPMSLIYGQALIDIFLKKVEYERVDYVRYLLGSYMLKNNMYQTYKEEIKLIRSKGLKRSLEFFYDLKKGKMRKEDYYSELRPFAKIIATYYFHRDTYLETFLKMDKIVFYDCDYSYNVANYLSLTDDRERLIELRDIIIPNILLTKDTFERQFFLNEFCRISTKIGRYKQFSVAYLELNKEMNK